MASLRLGHGISQGNAAHNACMVNSPAVRRTFATSKAFLACKARHGHRKSLSCRSGDSNEVSTSTSAPSDLQTRQHEQQLPSPPTNLSDAPDTQQGAGSSGGLLAGGAVGLGVAVFLAVRLAGGTPSFASTERAGVPLDTALSNDRPTVLEFYAPWCEVCRELVPQTYEVEQQYQGKVNFVLLDIDNSKWAPEALEYRVAGIPHFVFLDQNGQQLGAAVGRLPKQVLQDNTQALADGAQLPYARAAGATSSLQRSAGSMAGPRPVAPRDHA